MNIKKLVFRILLFPYLVSMFNSLCPLAMINEKVTDEETKKFAEWDIQLPNFLLKNDWLKYQKYLQIKAEEKRIKEEAESRLKKMSEEDLYSIFNTTLNKLIENFNKNKKTNQNICSITGFDEFKNILLNIIKDINKIMLLAIDNKIDFKVRKDIGAMTTAIERLFKMSVGFVNALENYYYHRNQYPFVFKYIFFNSILPELTDWIAKIKLSKNNEIEPIQSLSQEKKDSFIKYCSNISQNISEIFDLLIKETNACSYKKDTPWEIEYLKALKDENTGEEKTYDIFVGLNTNYNNSKYSTYNKYNNGHYKRHHSNYHNYGYYNGY